MTQAIKISAFFLSAALIVSASAYSCAIYNAEVERQETARMDICIKGGGKWRTSWNWQTWCDGR